MGMALIRLHVTHPPATPQALHLRLQLLSMLASKTKTLAARLLVQTVVAHPRKPTVVIGKGDAQMLF